MRASTGPQVNHDFVLAFVLVQRSFFMRFVDGRHVLTQWSASSPQYQPAPRRRCEAKRCGFQFLRCPPSFCADWLCVWPDTFASCTVGSTCSQRNVLPLWQMLSGQRPGFLLHDELLLHIRVTPVAISPLGGTEEGLCSVPSVGPLGPEPRLLSGPVLNWGYAFAHERLWVSRGFPSKRLPGASAFVVEQQLEAARQRRLEAAPYVEAVLERLVQEYSEAAVASWLYASELPAAARALQETAFLVAAAVLTLMCVVVPLAPVGELCCCCGCLLCVR